MLVSTSRYSEKGARELASALASVSGSIYAARGKKSVEKLVSEARKKGENTLALVSEKSISFISVSASGWSWKKETLRIAEYAIHDAAGEEGEAPSFEGNDAELFKSLFGSEEFHTGANAMRAEKGKLEFLDEGGKPMLEIVYEVVSDEEPRAD